MKWPSLFLLLLITASGCENDFEKARTSSIPAQNGSTNEQSITKYIDFRAFKDGNRIGTCSYKIEMLQSVIGPDTLWLITMVNGAISQGRGFYLYSSPSSVKYIRCKNGYDIELSLESQLSELGSQQAEVGTENIGFVDTYDALQDNYQDGHSQDTVSFMEKGKTCTNGNFIQLRKTFLITQHGEELKFKGSKLEISPLDNFSNSSRYQFIETNDFPRALKFEKTAGYKPVHEIHQNTQGQKVEKTSKYDSSGIFGKAQEE